MKAVCAQCEPSTLDLQVRDESRYIKSHAPGTVDPIPALQITFISHKFQGQPRASQPQTRRFSKHLAFPADDKDSRQPCIYNRVFHLFFHC